MGLKKYSLDDYIVCFTEQVKEKFFAKFRGMNFMQDGLMAFEIDTFDFYLFHFPYLSHQITLICFIFRLYDNS